MQSSARFDQVFECSGGPEITVGSERFRCCEPFFRPDLLGLARPGIHELISMSIKKCDVEIQNELWNNIIIIGGTANIAGMEARLEKELKALAPEGVRIVTTVDKSNLAWVGASVIASSLPASQWIDRQDYEEVGPVISDLKIAIYSGPLNQQ
jgi:actin-related protein